MSSMTGRIHCSIATAVAGTGRQCACIRSLAVATPGRARWTSRRRWDVPVRTLMQATLSCSSRSEEHTSELQSLMRISYAVFCLKKKHLETQYLRTNHTVIPHTHNTCSNILHIHHYYRHT